MKTQIKIHRLAGAFMATVPGTRAVGTGNTWMEAIGSLVATMPQMFGVDEIAYAQDTVTKNYLIERGLNERIS